MKNEKNEDSAFEGKEHSRENKQQILGTFISTVSFRTSS
jgi:hypothetical protein